MNKDFPVNVFPDVERNAFKKFSKKNVTEDYIKENLKRKGWECYQPFTDTGLDLVATKIINGNRIYRYIQIKTRSLVDGKFGYTLKSKDFETDPRKFYFLYCDTVDDVIILSSLEYFRLCRLHYAVGQTHFGIPAFRNNNNKLNSLTYSNGLWTWNYKSRDGHPKGCIDFSPYLNDTGLKKMENDDIDINLEIYSNEIANIKKELFYIFLETPKTKELFQKGKGELINEVLRDYAISTNFDYINKINNIKENFKLKNPDLYESHRKYVIDEMLKGDNHE